jgi:thioredoxin
MATGDGVVDVTDETFETTVLRSPLPVLVDCWASWCKPCRMVAPIFEQLASLLGDRLRFARLDVDHNQAVAYRLQVSSLPTFILFKDGTVADRMMGAVPEAAFRSFLEQNGL